MMSRTVSLVLAKMQNNQRSCRIYQLYILPLLQKKAQKTPSKEIEKALELKKDIMQPRNDISSFDAILDAQYGAVGTAEREAFRKEATNYCIGQIILDVRKQEHMTQSDLARQVGTDKTYISRIEKGVIEPGVGMFFRIVEALGLRVNIVRPLM